MFKDIHPLRMLKALRSFSNQYYVNWKKKLGYCHPTAGIVNPTYILGPENVIMEEDTVIKDATIMTPVCKFTMKKHSGAAPGLCVLTGNHMRVIGRFYRSIKQEEKVEGYDKSVIVEEDCWIGANVTLLQGVVVRRGTTLAAGAVVNKSTLPYSIWGGVPAKLIKVYWTIDQILEHEKQLYPENERYTREQLEEFYSSVKKD